MPTRQQLVGVVTYYPELPKHYLLLFDSIVMNSSEDLLNIFAIAPDDELRGQAADLRYLQEHGVLSLMFPSQEFQQQYAKELLEYEKAAQENTPIRLDIPQDVGSNEKFERIVAADRAEWDETGRQVNRVNDARVRLTAIQLRLKGINAVPILSNTIPVLSAEVLASSQVALVDVARVTLNAFPIPAADTPLEALLEFRQNEEAKGSIADLHRWMRKIGRQEISLSELEDELDGLLDVYSRQMKIHRMKYENTRLRSLITLPLELIEGIAKLKLASLASKPFDIRDARISLLEAELLGPGKEVAFIAHAKDELQQPLSGPSPKKVVREKAARKSIGRPQIREQEPTDIYVKYLAEQGYEPRVTRGEKWNYISFTKNGKSYRLALDASKSSEVL